MAEGKQLNVMYSDPPTLDPHIAQDSTSAGIILEIYSGLVSLDTNLQIIPDIAESWTISNDGMKYTFKLRDNAKFHNGKYIKAEDFLWSFNRAANPSTNSITAEDYLGDIVGVQDVIDGKADKISGIKLIDELTLEINIYSPKAYFLAKLTYPPAFLLSKKYVENTGENWIDKPVGTGPFVLVDYQIGQVLKIARNDNYWGDPAKIEGVIFNLAGGTSMAMYENDEIDITGVGLADLERVKDPNDSLNKDLVDVPPQFTLSYIGFNVKEPPFDDINFRKALSHSVDKALIAEKIYSGLTQPAYGILPVSYTHLTLPTILLV